MAPAERSCGPCQACCVVLAVPALNKAAGQRCRHLQDPGCAIHPDRPPICRGFVCNWLAGDPALGDTDRPEQSGVLVWVERGVAGLTVRVHELRPDALDDPRFQGAMAVWRRFPVVVQRADGQRALELPIRAPFTKSGPSQC